MPTRPDADPFRRRHASCHTGSLVDSKGPSKTQAQQALRAAAAPCRACDLWTHATQTVFGAGSPRATILLVGEQPGNEEDVAGRPFVGPAGRVLARALASAGLDRAQVYVTNVVKHFKWEARQMADSQTAERA